MDTSEKKVTQKSKQLWAISLPKVLLAGICKYLEGNELCCVATACKAWKDMTEERVWKDAFLGRWLALSAKPNITWKENFRKRAGVDNNMLKQRSTERVLLGHLSTVMCVAVSQHNNGTNLVASGDVLGSLRLWNATEAKCVHNHDLVVDNSFLRGVQIDGDEYCAIAGTGTLRLGFDCA